MKYPALSICIIIFSTIVPRSLSAENNEISSILPPSLPFAATCPDGMVEIEGNYCPQVKETCLRWLDTSDKVFNNEGLGHMRCAEFKQPSECLSNNRKHLHYCMSKFEYPGVEGSYPLVGMDYFEAKSLAEKEGNRLCTKEEFNFACEGKDIHPYGYGDGFHRDENICNIDKKWIDYNKFPRHTWNDPTAGLYQAVKSDSNSLCRSWSGVYNLNGNVDEILNSEHTKNVVLSGGYWSFVRARCRPTTDAHNKQFSFYQIGFRTCSDVNK